MSSEAGDLGKPDNEGVRHHLRSEEDESGGLGATSHHITGRLDTLTEFINLHIRCYRLIPYVTGAVGVVFLLCYFRVPIRRIRQVSDIPQELITGNRKLSGVVKVTGHDSLGVWHVPTWKWMLSFGTHPPKECLSKDLLRVQFSGVSINDYTATAAWLKECVLGKKVWLKLLDRTSKDSVHCMVYSKKPRTLWKKCVNKELLELGIASVEEVKGVNSNAEYVRLTAALLQTEQTAKQKGIGVWQGTEYVTWWNRLKNYFLRKGND